MIEALKNHIRSYDSAQVFVLRDSKVSCDLPYPTLVIDVSEGNKSLATVERVWCWLAEHNATRKAVLINVGGGCLCDIGGFAAATYMRGIDFINVPTTLLAMVDAAIGGKTGVNFRPAAPDRIQTAVLTEYRLLKNYIGAFRLPKAVVIETAFLETLPAEELLSGFGEVLKTALLMGGDTLSKALQITELRQDHYGTSSGFLAAFLQPELTNLIAACKSYKESIVAEDPEEKGLRKVLNFGHTVGHAMEEMSDVRSQKSEVRSRHGYCVAWGIVAELYLSVVVLGCKRELLTQISHFVIEHFGKPQCNCKQEGELIALMHKDKKNADSQGINFTLLRQAGEPVIDQVVDEGLIQEAIEYLFSL